MLNNEQKESKQSAPPTSNQEGEISEDSEIDINQVIKTEVSEAIGPVTEKLDSLETKFTELLAEVKKKRTAIKLTVGEKKIPPIEELKQQEIDKFCEQVLKAVT